MPNITDEQAAQIKQIIEERNQLQQIVRGAQELWNDPKTSARAKALWKEKWPDADIPGFDQEQKLTGIVNDFEKKRQDEKKEAEIKEHQDRLARQRADVMQRGSYTEDGMHKLEALMKERDILDYEAGDLLFRAKNPMPSDGAADADAAHYWNYDKQPEAQEIARDPERWGFEELRKAVDADARGRSNRRF